MHVFSDSSTTNLDFILMTLNFDKVPNEIETYVANKIYLVKGAFKLLATLKLK